MKRLFLILTALLCANVLFAQSVSNITVVKTQHTQMVNALLKQHTEVMPAFKTTSVAPTERVIAISHRFNTLSSLVDSVNFRYSSYRASTYDYNMMLYPYNYPYNSSPMFNYAGVATKPQVLFDTMMHWEVNPNTLVYGPYESGYATYNSKQCITGYKSLYADSPIYTNMIFINKFNAANNIDTGLWFNFHTGISDSAFKQFFKYNTANKIIADSIYELHLGVWRIVSKSYYTYDGANDLVTIDNYSNTTDTSFLLPLVEQLKYTNTYDASHRLLTVKADYFDGATLAPYVKDTFAYTGTMSYHTAWRQHQWDAINTYWAPVFNMTKKITAGLPDTIYTQGFDSLLNSWVPQTKQVVSYNSFKDPDTMWEFQFNFVTFPTTPDFTTVYYYQNYYNNVAVQDVRSTVGTMLVYPNPVSDICHISTTDIAANAAIFITVTNMSGQVVSREKMSWQGAADISMRNFIPGVYMLTLQADGKVLQQVVVKQ